MTWPLCVVRIVRPCCTTRTASDFAMLAKGVLLHSVKGCFSSPEDGSSCSDALFNEFVYSVYNVLGCMAQKNPINVTTAIVVGGWGWGFFVVTLFQIE